MTMKEAVRETALKLDWDRPGWEECIDADRLNIASAKNCILGQVYGGFGKGLEALGIRVGAEAGVSLCMGSKTPRQDWHRLRALWLEEISVRRSGDELEGARSEEMAVA